MNDDVRFGAWQFSCIAKSKFPNLFQENQDPNCRKYLRTICITALRPATIRKKRYSTYDEFSRPSIIISSTIISAFLH